MGRIHPAAHEIRQGHTVFWVEDYICHFTRPEMRVFLLYSHNKELPPMSCRITEMPVYHMRELIDIGLFSNGVTLFWSRKRAMREFRSSEKEWRADQASDDIKRRIVRTIDPCDWGSDYIQPMTLNERWDIEDAEDTQAMLEAQNVVN